MRFLKSAIVALLGATLVAGCGGGGGSGASPPVSSSSPPGASNPSPVTASGAWLTLTPGSVSITNYQGEASRFVIKATSTRTFDKPFNVGIIDSKGVVSSQVSVSKMSELEYWVSLKSEGLAPGTHASTLEVRLCEDAPAVCSKPLPGSPWYVPVTVNVVAVADAQQRMTLTPAAIDLVTYEGEPTSFQLNAKVNSSFDVPVSLGVFDSAGVLASNVVVNPAARDLYSPRLTTASGLALGVHATSLEVRLCYDNPLECKSPVIGSPWRLPIKVTVKPGTNLTTLAKIPALSSWSAYNGNAAQTAYVPESFDPATFTRRWSKLEGDLGPLTAPAIENGKVFAVRGTVYDKRELVAIDEATGQILWRNDMGTAGKVNPPAAADGKVFVTSTSPLIMLWVFDQSTGQQLKTQIMSIMSDCTPGVTVAGGMVYSSFNRVSRYNPATSALEWSNGLVTNNVCAPSVEGGLVYGYTPNEVYALNAADGSLAYTIKDQASQAQGAKGAPLVLGDGMGFAIDGARLLGFDLRSRTRAWVAEGAPAGQPVLAKGIVYSLGDGGTVVEARAAATGIVQWKSAALTTWSPYEPYGRMVVTSNLLFASSAEATVAIDLVTHQVVWSYPLGGDLSISDRGVLYIMSPKFKQAAINLR